MRAFALVGLGTAALVLAGCGVRVRQPSQGTAHEAVNKLAYAQDLRTGLCYAVVSSASMTHVNDQGMTITWVPCEPKVLAQIKQ